MFYVISLIIPYYLLDIKVLSYVFRSSRRVNSEQESYFLKIQVHIHQRINGKSKNYVEDMKRAFGVNREQFTKIFYDYAKMFLKRLENLYSKVHPEVYIFVIKPRSYL